MSDDVAVSALDFACTSCGNCCRSLRVAVTARDLARLARAVSLPAEQLIEWLEPDRVDMSGEPDSFVELAAGRRLMVLAQHESACRLLGSDNLCGAYAARPRDCRAFPFDFSGPTRSAGLLPLADCDYRTTAHNDLAALAVEDTLRWNELREYRAQVARWNRRAWHRRRLHKSVGDASQFLAHVLAELRASEPA